MKQFYSLVAAVALIAANVQSNNASILATNEVAAHEVPELWSCAFFLCDNNTANWYDYITFFVDNDTVIGGVQYQKLWYINSFLYFDTQSLSTAGQLQDNMVQQGKTFVCPIRYTDDGKNCIAMSKTTNIFYSIMTSVSGKRARCFPE